MLHILRKKGVSKKILWAILIIIIISFGFLGSASYLSYSASAGAGKAGKIFGKWISKIDFLRQYAATEDRAIMLYGQQFFKIRQYLNLEQETWDRIILLNQAHRHGFKASDSEVIDFIHKIRMFQRETGKFDRFLYKDILREYFKCTPRDFEESIRDQLVIQKLYDQETASVTVGAEELFQEYQKRNEKIQVSYVFFPFADFLKELPATEEEIKKYYESHKEEFFLPPSVNVESVRIDFPPEASDEDKKAAADRAFAVHEELTTNPDFAAVLEKNKLTAAASGFFSQEAPNLGLGLSFEALQQVFSYSVGQISAPWETPEGWQIFRLKEKKEAYVPEFKDAAVKVKEAVLQGKAKALAQHQAESIQPLLKEAFEKSSAKNFASAAKTLNLPVEQTPFFGRGEYLPNIGLSGEFQEAALGLSSGQELSGVVETAKGLCILHRDGTQAVEREKFEKDRASFAEQILGEKKNAHLTEFLARIRNDAKLVDLVPKKEGAATAPVSN